MVLIKCHSCGHVWNYKGFRLKYVNCPSCHFNCMISKDKINNNDNNNSLINSLNNNNLSNEIKVLQNKISELNNKVNSIENILNKTDNPIKKDLKNITSNNISNTNLKGVKINCVCGHSWIYKGNLKTVRCSNCNKRIYLK